MPDLETPPVGGDQEPSESQNKKDERDGKGIDFGFWILLSFATITLIGTAIRGFIPLDIIEVAFWAALALLWHKKKIVSQGSKAAVGILAILVAFGEGYSEARHKSGSYTYLQMGNYQVRVDSSAGRTDRLWSTGWKPISFDREASEMNVIDAIFSAPLSNGQWVGERICFDVQNNSNYIIKAIDVSVKVTPKSTTDSPTTLPIVLHPQVFGLLDTGDEDRFCGTAGAFPGLAEWSYDVQKYTGWKK